MGCNKVCKAKKQAADAEKQANAARNQKPPAGPSVPGVPQPKGTNVEVTTVGHVLGVHEKKNALTPWEMISKLSEARRNPQILANSTAAGLITPIQAAFGTFVGLFAGQIAANVAKPIVKMAVNIGGIVFNFANIAELLGDVALLILTIFVGLAPIFLSLLKNVFLSIPLDIGIMTTYQMDQLKTLVELSKIDIKNSFIEATQEIESFSVVEDANSKALDAYLLGGGTLYDKNGNPIPTPQPFEGMNGPVIYDDNGNKIGTNFNDINDSINDYIDNNDAPYNLEDILDIDELKEEFIKAFTDGMNSCKESILENLSNNLKNQEINILDIEDVDTLDLENKNKVKNVANGLHSATKQIELLQAGELLDRRFSVSGQEPDETGVVYDDNDLAIAAALLMIKDLENQLKTPGHVDVNNSFLTVFDAEVEKKKDKTIEVREDLIALDLAQDIILQNTQPFVVSMMNNVGNIKLNKNDFINLDDCYQNTILNEFNTLKSMILTQQTAFINSSNISNTQDMINLRNSVYANTQQSVNDFLIVIDDECIQSFGKSVCDSIDNFKSALYAAIKKSIEDGKIDIKDLDIPEGVDKYEFKKMVNLLLDEVKKRLVKQSSDIIVQEVVPCKSCKPCEDMILDMNLYVNKGIQKSKANIIRFVESQIMNLDMTITDANSIIDKKNLLISNLNMALLRNSNELQVLEDMIFRIEQEEKELLKNIKLSLQAAM